MLGLHLRCNSIGVHGTPHNYSEITDKWKVSITQGTEWTGHICDLFCVNGQQPLLILCALRNALEQRRRPKTNNRGKAEEEQMGKAKGERKKKKGMEYGIVGVLWTIASNAIFLLE